MKATWSKRILNFKRPAGTSRGIMRTRVVWYIFILEEGISGIGECAPLPGLSIDDFNTIESMLNEVCANPKFYIDNLSQLKDFPAIRFGFESAHLDWLNGGGQKYFLSNFKQAIDINGLIWMGDSDFMLQQIERKLNQGWQCIKIKIGALDFATELKILQAIRNRFSQDKLQLRVDANGAFRPLEVKDKLQQLAKFNLHSIEQPIKIAQHDLLAELCKTSPVPIALDEELICLLEEDERQQMLEKIKPQFLVLKPSLLGGFIECEKWIKLAKQNGIGWWVTSSLESNIGLNAIAQWVSRIKPDGFQGLGTGQLFSNNIPSPLSVKSGKLYKDSEPIWREANQFISRWLNPSQIMQIQTSGSTGKIRTISVYKKWMRNSAKLSAKTFGLKSGDSALLCLPLKYIAGKMMLVRAIELGLDLKVLPTSSNPLKNIDQTIDFVAMLPLQLEKSLKHLKKVKILIVGGARVSSGLIKKLQTISTPVYETYGMTETLTHVASKRLNGANKSSVFTALDGVKFTTDKRNCLVIYTPLVNPEPVISNDIVELINQSSFKLLGRIDNVINSGGVKVIPELVEEKLEPIMAHRQFFVTGLPDEFLGEKVVLLVEGAKTTINFECLDKYEKPKTCYFLPKFIKTITGKVNRQKTSKLIV